MEVLFYHIDKWKLGTKKSYKGLLDVITNDDMKTHIDAKKAKYYTINDVFKGKAFVAGEYWEIWKDGNMFQFEIETDYTPKIQEGEPDIGIEDSLYLKGFTIKEVRFIQEKDKKPVVDPTPILGVILENYLDLEAIRKINN